MNEHPRILCIEDDALQRAALVSLLEADGFETEEVGDVRAARRRLGAERFACVVSDYRLPDGTLEELFADGLLDPARTMVVSGATPPRPSLVHSGSYFGKPLDWPRFRARLSAILDDGA